MRILALTAVLVLAVACGKDGDSSLADISLPSTDGGNPSLTMDGAAARDSLSATEGGAGKRCLEIKVCYSACKDEACEAKCLGEGSATGKAQMTAAETCRDESFTGACKTTCATSQQSAGCLACVMERCTELNFACLTGGENGTTLCQPTTVCMSHCGTTDYVCTAACLRAATAAAQEQFVALSVCYAKARANPCAGEICAKPDDVCGMCLAEACASEETACLATSGS